jgi:hypothetical protein
MCFGEQRSRVTFVSLYLDVLSAGPKSSPFARESGSCPLIVSGKGCISFCHRSKDLELSAFEWCGKARSVGEGPAKPSR